MTIIDNQNLPWRDTAFTYLVLYVCMIREAPILKFDYWLRNDYCKPIIDYGKEFDYYTPNSDQEMSVIPHIWTIMLKLHLIDLLSICYTANFATNSDKSNRWSLSLSVWQQHRPSKVDKLWFIVDFVDPTYNSMPWRDFFKVHSCA